MASIPDCSMVSPAGKYFRHIASLKVAIPLLVLTVLVTIVGSLQPDTDYYRTWWYLGLLGLNGVSLLLITLLHIPAILVKKGRNALIGVVATHLGILVLLAGIIYGGVSSDRFAVKMIEGEMTVVPGLPFVIFLEELIIEEYPADSFTHLNLEALPKKRQESRIRIYQGGEAGPALVAGPGFPAKFDGYTLLPSVSDTGWYFELEVTDPLGRTSFVPVRPWAPPLVVVGPRQIMAHSVLEGEQFSAQLFTIANGQTQMLGTLTERGPLELEGHSVALGKVRRYTGLAVYNRPHAPVLIAGSSAMLLGLLWHFYHRHRDRRRERGGSVGDA